MQFRFVRAVALTLVFAALLTACGGSADTQPGEAPPPFVATFPDDTLGGGEDPGVVVPPPPGRAPHFDGDTFAHERTAFFGSFPSDLVSFEDTLFCVDADQIESEGALIVPLDASLAFPRLSERFLPVAIRAADLVDDQRAAGDLGRPVGFGFFVGDLLIAGETLGFALVNAGGSDSSPALANLVVFDPSAGRIRQVVSLAHVLPDDGQYVDSEGRDVPDTGFVQSGAEAVAYVPTGQGGGRLYVAMSNLLFGAPSHGTFKYPGTLQVFDVAPASLEPVRARPRGALITETLVVEGYNPVSLTLLDVPLAPSRLLVTVAGATAYDDAFRLQPRTPASVEAYDAQGGTYLGRFELGLTGLAGARPAVGLDLAGHHIGFFPSAVTGEIYLLRLDGLFAQPIDPDRVAVLRGPHNGIPIRSQDAGGPGGNVTGALLLDGGRTLAVTGFGDLFAFPTPEPGRLYLLPLPSNVVTGSAFGANFIPGATLHATTAGRTLGAVVAGEGVSDRPDLYVNVSGSIDPTSYGGTSPASVGALWLRALGTNTDP